MIADRILLNDTTTTTTTMVDKPPESQQQQQQQQQQPQLKCPRCDSSNTKFCYYNNYSLSQPRHFCKACKRYWTRGGTLRNVPVGGGCRKNKRSSATKKPSTSIATIATATSRSDAQPPSQPITNHPIFYSSPLDVSSFMIPGQINYNLLGLGYHHQPSNQSDLPQLHYTRASAASADYEDYHALLHFDDLEAGAKRIKLEGDANAVNQLDWQLPCENSFGSVSAAAAAAAVPVDSSFLYWNTASAWPDAANFGSSVSPLI